MFFDEIPLYSAPGNVCGGDGVTRFQLMVPVPNQKPPNLEVVIVW